MHNIRGTHKDNYNISRPHTVVFLLDFMPDSVRNMRIGENICAAELVTGFENIGQHWNLFLFPLLVSLSPTHTHTHTHKNNVCGMRFHRGKTES